MPTLLLFLRMVIALAVVLGLVMLATRLVARGRGALVTTRRSASAFGMPAGRGPRRSSRPAGGLLGGFGVASRATPAPLEVLGRRSLSRTAALVIARAGERYVLLGTTPQSVALLAELSPAELGIEPPLPGPAATGRTAARPATSAWSEPVRPSAGSGQDDVAGLAGLAGLAAPDGAPWTASQDAGSNTAWDAFLATLRERTVRR